MNRQSIRADYSTLVTFVKAKESREEIKNVESKIVDRIKKKEDKQSGEEARKFYEETLTIKTRESTDSKLKHQNKVPKMTKEKCKQPPAKCRTKISANLVNECLKIAQNGDEEKMKELISKGANVTQCDNFGWDALMCAAYNGHIAVVKLLLRNGASKLQCDTKGRTAAALAGLKGHTSVKTYIENFNCNEDLRERNRELKREITDDESFFCPVCKSNFKESSKTAHGASTVHLFNMKLKPKEDPFVIPSSNVGYKLMMKSGWDGQKGLGAESQGKRHPIKTVLKRDRACLGSEVQLSKKARVTHFGPNDPDAVKKSSMNLDRKMTAKTLSKKVQKFREKKAKNWEKNLRQYMNMD
ncbi:hypothetical protein FSP39_007124 [Pinctada imbricata]|uniref:G-patch domain-containing protein n=1 Tax=Pinctada imbricata TaxID=66713 RepID=A0AA88XYK8_PINIB|nr:hypothetical protein FSP39_007124 [Pinctada imbricata]